eukprot:1192770-Pyramimonas_sp.AAC.4
MARSCGARWLDVKNFYLPMSATDATRKRIASMIKRVRLIGRLEAPACARQYPRRPGNQVPPANEAAPVHCALIVGSGGFDGVAAAMRLGWGY